jgi:uncharacterized protein YbbC (DUF1343 family)
MPGAFRISALRLLSIPFALTLVGGGCSSEPPRAGQAAPVPHPSGPASAPPRVEPPFPVMMGIDVLEAGGFAPLRDKRIGLLTHPAGVDRRGVSTIEILRRAPGVRLVALFGAEHGVYNEIPVGKIYGDHVDPRTGLMVHSLYNGSRFRRPTAAQLRGIDALVIDLQDIGSRSYTFVSAMKSAMEGCFQNNVEVIVLDRPNPLGGLKVDGPPMDPMLMSYVGDFPVPYVHGLTIGELARLAKFQPGVLQVPEDVRARGRLLVVPMRGWRRSMRWPETGLAWEPTSPLIPDFSAVAGYPMTGLSSEVGGFVTGREYPFRAISHKNIRPEEIQRELEAFHIPGIGYRRVSVTNGKTGQPGTALYVEIKDWDEWRPTELNFYLMKLSCRHQAKNPFASLTPSEAGLFQKLMGSAAFFRDIAAHGSRVDVDAYVREWQLRDAVFQEGSRRYWLYQ